MSLGRLGTGEVGKDLGKAEASSSSQTNPVPEVPEVRSVLTRCVNIGSQGLRKTVCLDVFRFDKEWFLLSSPAFTSTPPPAPGRGTLKSISWLGKCSFVPLGHSELSEVNRGSSY